MEIRRQLGTTGLVATGLLLTLALAPVLGPVHAKSDTESPLRAKSKDEDKIEKECRKLKKEYDRKMRKFQKEWKKTHPNDPLPPMEPFRCPTVPPPPPPPPPPDHPGRTWERLTDSTVINSPRSLAVDPSDTRRMYVGTSGSGAWSSTDYGKTWTMMGTLPKMGEFRAMLVCPGSPNVVLAANASCGLFRSVDAGQNWTHLGIDNGLGVSSGTQSGSPPTFALAVLATNPPTLVAAVVDNKGCGTYRSVDSGATWTRSGPLTYSDAHMTELVTARSDSKTVYALTGSYLYRSSDAAQTWTKLTVPSGSFSAVAVHPGDPNTLYLAEPGRGIWKTTDSGAAWTCLVGGLSVTGTDLRVLTIDPVCSSVMYTGGALGSFVSVDAGVTWKFEATLIPTRIDVSGDVLYVHDNSTIFGRHVIPLPPLIQSSTN